MPPTPESFAGSFVLTGPTGGSGAPAPGVGPATTVGALGEFGLVDAVVSRFATTADVLLGPGDDTELAGASRYALSA